MSKYLMVMELIFANPCRATLWGSRRLKFIIHKNVSDTSTTNDSFKYDLLLPKKLGLGASLLGYISGFYCRKDNYGTKTV